MPASTRVETQRPLDTKQLSAALDQTLEAGVLVAPADDPEFPFHESVLPLEEVYSAAAEARSGRAANCAASVEPASAVVEALPPAIAWLTASK